MILWIVEDERKEARKVLAAVQAAFPGMFQIYANEDITWPNDAPLPKLNPVSDELAPPIRQPRSPEHLPDIVVLDLTVKDQESEPGRNDSEWSNFPGSLFYDRLREEEDNAHKRRSQVIIYSQYRGMSYTQNFVTKHQDDHRFDDIDAKSPGLLVEKLHDSITKVQTGE